VRTITALLAAMSATLALSGCAEPTQTFQGVPVPRLKAFSHGDNTKLDRKAQEHMATEPRFDNVGYATWDAEAEPPYRLYPGDEVEMRTPGAPENNKTVTIGPDGRVALPLVGDVMMANRNLDEVRQDLEHRYGSQLRRPTVELSVKAAPIKVFVGGEVNLPNAYEMIGDGNTLNAVIQAGGFRTSADTKHVVLIRRSRDGGAMMKTVNLEQAFHHGWQPLRRGDVIYVPRSGVAKVGLFMQEYLRDALPVSFSYAIGTNAAYVSR
jgi:protein involved in polysaccharide export with SLBB domain